jgi:NADH dehydrogenase [ubiquinone] 1 alpha subcomplex assembly factor 7
MALSDLLRRRIAATGPMTVADFMTEALGHPEHGYYTQREPFGPKGDFVTAPEISQIFGELIGAWCVHQWVQMGAPASFNLVELGPGRGTLMADLLRTASKLSPAFRDAADLRLVETSPRLRDLQARALGGARPHWHDSLNAVPEGPLLCIANEFFDALPIRQFVRTSVGWAERLVDIDPSGERLRFVAGGAQPAASFFIPADLLSAPPGSIVEISPVSWTLAHDLAERVAVYGGTALIIDYGSVESGIGDTLQAVRAHRYAPVLENAGEADLTAHVDFAMLTQAALEAGGAVHGPVTQAEFLAGLGIRERAAILRQKASPEQHDAIEAAVARLIDEDQMGSLFKVLALTPAESPRPAGFQTA